MQDPIAAARQVAQRHLDASTLRTLDTAAATCAPRATADATADAACSAAADGFRAAAKGFASSAAALAVLDWGAEVLREAGQIEHGGDLFKLARAKESVARIAVAPLARRERISRFAARCMVGNATLVAHVVELARLVEAAAAEAEVAAESSASAEARAQLDGAEAEGVLALIVAWMQAAGDELDSSQKRHLYRAQVGVLTLELLDAVALLGRACQQNELVTQLLERALPHLHACAHLAWSRHGEALVRLLRGSARHRDHVADSFPLLDLQRSWREVLLEGGVVDHVAARGPEAAARWLEQLADWYVAHEAGAEGWLDRVTAILAPVLRQLSTPLALRGAKTDADVDVALVELLIAREIPFTVEAATFNLYYWANRENRRPLRALAAHPLGARLHASYANHRHDSLVMNVVLASPELSFIFDAITADLERRLSGATLARLDQEMSALKKLLTPTLLEMRPDLRALIAGLDLADMLARNLRAGIMDELHWPAQEAANATFSSPARQYDTDGPFPYWVMSHRDDGVIVVLGPEGELYRQRRPDEVPDSPRAMRFVAGDVLYFAFVGSLRVARWISTPEHLFNAEIWDTWTLGVPTPGGNVWEGTRTLRPGGSEHPTNEYAELRFSDGRRYWLNGQEIDPDTERQLGAGQPEWLSGPDIVLDACTYWPVPAGLASSLPGLVDGQWGIRVRALPEGGHALETLDGQRWTGSIPGAIPHGLLRFPLREHDVIYTEHDSDKGLWMADGSHPVMPVRHQSFEHYWAGAPQWLPFAWWHYLVPRDLEGSAALIATTTAQARALLDAAALARAQDAEAPLQTSASFAAALAAVMPQLRHPRMRAGVTRLVELAVEREEDVKLWRAVAAPVTAPVTAPAQAAAPADAQAAAPAAELVDGDVSELAVLFKMNWFFAPALTYGHFERSLRRAAQFLAEPGVARAGYEASPSHYSLFPWRRLLRDAGAVLWALLRPVSSPAARQKLRKILEVWADSDFAAAPAEFRILDLQLSPAPKQSPINIQAATRYVLFEVWDGNDQHFEALERRHAGGFIDPDWAKVLATTLPRGPDRATITAALSALDARGLPELSSELIERLSAATGLLPATAALLWTGGFHDARYYDDPDESDEDHAEHHEALGLDAFDVELAAHEIAALRLDVVELYARALPDDPRALYAPLQDDGSGRSPVERFAAALHELVGMPPSFDRALLGSMHRALRIDSAQLLRDARALADPDEMPIFTADERWVLRPWEGFQNNVSYRRGIVPPGWPKHESQSTDDEVRRTATAFSGWVLRELLQYVPWAHQELPLGHPMRARLARMCALVAARLDNPSLLLLAGAIDLSEQQHPQRLAEEFAQVKRRFSGEPYVASDAGAGGESAPGLDRGDLIVTWPSDLDNSFFLAFRPQRVADPAAFARLAADLGLTDVFNRTGGGCTCGLNFGSYKVVDITDLSSWLVWKSEGFQQIVAALGEVSPKGASAYQSDPRVSCPALVAEVSAHHGFSEDAATYWLQLATLAEPHRDTIMRINGWTDEVLEDAAHELLTRGLIVAGRVDELDDRYDFLPDALAFPEAPAAPLEARKLALYGLEPDAQGRLRAPFGVVLPLRPLQVLFAQAWAQARRE